MKVSILSTAMLLAVAAAVSGCVAGKPLVLTQSVGPRAVVEAREASRGELVVYSAWDRFDTLDSEHRKHTAYTVRGEGGDVLHIQNRRGSFGEDPETVALAPGKYWVEARATNVGPVRVPVMIREGGETVVYLDGVTAPPAPWRAQETNWIRQPNGLIVGWADTASTP
jgi:hypothetical protein